MAGGGKNRRALQRAPVADGAYASPCRVPREVCSYTPRAMHANIKGEYSGSERSMF